MEVLPKLNLTALRKESRLNRWDSSLGGSYYDGDYNSLCCILPAVYFRKVRHNWVYFAEGLVVLTTLAYTGVSCTLLVFTSTGNRILAISCNFGVLSITLAVGLLMCFLEIFQE